MDDFISVIQGVPEERKQMTRHLFSSIDYLFRPNNPLDMAMEEPIFFKLLKVHSLWRKKAIVLGWLIDTSQKILTLLSTLRGKLSGALAAILNILERVWKKKWYQILGILRSTVPKISEVEILFSRLHHALKTVDARKVKLTLHAHDKINLW